MSSLPLAISLFALIYFLRDKFELKLGGSLVLVYGILLSIIFHDAIVLFAGAIIFIVSEIDRREQRIPDVVTKPALFGLTMIFHEQLDLLLLAWGWIALMYLVTLMMPGAIGRGDIKLIAVLLLLNGHLHVQTHGRFLIDLLFLASVFALPFAVATRMRSGRKAFAFGPAIAGAWIWLVGLNLA